MNILEIIKLSIQNLFSFKFRSFLTMLGIIIGISSVVILSSLGSGFQAKMVGDLKDSFSSLINVSINQKYLNESKYKSSELFTKNDEKLILNMSEFEYVDVSNTTTLLEDKTSKYTMVYGGGNKYLKVYGKEIIRGVKFIEGKENLAIISENTEKKLFKGKSAIGQEITLNYFSKKRAGKFIIIGVYNGNFDKQAEVFGDNIPLEIILSMEAVDKFTNNKLKKYTEIIIKPKNSDNLKYKIDLIKKYLETKSNKKDMYTVKPLSQELDKVLGILNKLSLFINLVASVAIIVGGIGVMNIMLVSVKERITEIGLRKAIGAKNRDILIQYLIETVIITLIGGLIGIILGYLISIIIGSFVNVMPILEIKIIVISFIISSLTGLIFGIYPARQASKLSPMEALRKE